MAVHRLHKNSRISKFHLVFSKYFNLHIQLFQLPHNRSLIMHFLAITKTTVHSTTFNQILSYSFFYCKFNHACFICNFNIDTLHHSTSGTSTFPWYLYTLFRVQVQVSWWSIACSNIDCLKPFSHLIVLLLGLQKTADVAYRRRQTIITIFLYRQSRQHLVLPYYGPIRYIATHRFWSWPNML